jgi:hypothetical protein
MVATLATNKNSLKKNLELPILVLLFLTGLIPEPITPIYIGSVPSHMKLNLTFNTPNRGT